MRRITVAFGAVDTRGVWLEPRLAPIANPGSTLAAMRQRLGSPLGWHFTISGDPHQALGNRHWCWYQGSDRPRFQLTSQIQWSSPGVHFIATVLRRPTLPPVSSAALHNGIIQQCFREQSAQFCVLFFELPQPPRVRYAESAKFRLPPVKGRLRNAMLYAHLRNFRSSLLLLQNLNDLLHGEPALCHVGFSQRQSSSRVSGQSIRESRLLRTTRSSPRIASVLSRRRPRLIRNKLVPRL
jgi:hypothetical protein